MAQDGIIILDVAAVRKSEGKSYMNIAMAMGKGYWKGTDEKETEAARKLKAMSQDVNKFQTCTEINCFASRGKKFAGSLHQFFPLST